jgi:nitroreductase
MPDAAEQISLPDYGYGRREPAEGLNGAEAAISTRRSVRAYLKDKPVDQALIEKILNVAARAPSGTNVQPWHVIAVAGEVKQKVSAAVHADRDAGGKPGMGYNYYPVNWFEPYLGRRRKLGWDMYGLLDIAKGEREKTYQQHGRNFDFFDAPVGLFFHMDKRLEVGSFLDMGLFVQSVMIAARSHGLDTCPQAAWVDYGDLVGSVIGMPEDHMLICGICLGYEDTSKVVNDLYSEREPASNFAKFEGF